MVARFSRASLQIWTALFSREIGGLPPVASGAAWMVATVEVGYVRTFRGKPDSILESRGASDDPHQSTGQNPTRPPGPPSTAGLRSKPGMHCIGAADDRKRYAV